MKQGFQTNRPIGAVRIGLYFSFDHTGCRNLRHFASPARGLCILGSFYDRLHPFFKFFGNLGLIALSINLAVKMASSEGRLSLLRNLDPKILPAA